MVIANRGPGQGTDERVLGFGRRPFPMDERDGQIPGVPELLPEGQDPLGVVSGWAENACFFRNAAPILGLRA